MLAITFKLVSLADVYMLQAGIQTNLATSKTLLLAIYRYGCIPAPLSGRLVLLIMYSSTTHLHVQLNRLDQNVVFEPGGSW